MYQLQFSPCATFFSHIHAFSPDTARHSNVISFYTLFTYLYFVLDVRDKE